MRIERPVSGRQRSTAAPADGAANIRVEGTDTLTTEQIAHDVRDLRLAEEGVRRIEWAAREMPVTAQIRERFAKERPLNGVRVAACLHVTTETANLMIALRDGGAEIALCASNPLSTQDDVAAALVAEYGISTFAIKGEDNDTYYRHIDAALEHAPQITMDDGADLVARLHRDRTDLLPDVIGGTEETTTGVIRLRALAQEGELKYPIIAVNEANTKHMFDNRYGTGQSTLDGIIRATNVLLRRQDRRRRRLRLVRARSRRSRARGMGAHVIVTEVDPLPALEAVMDGFRVMPMAEAARDRRHLRHAHRRHQRPRPPAHGGDEGRRDPRELRPLQRRDQHQGARDDVRRASREVRAVRRGVPARRRPQAVPARRGPADQPGRRRRPPGERDGHELREPGAQSSSTSSSSGKKLEAGVYPVPQEIDAEIARLKLESMGIAIDTLTAEQEKYLTSWECGHVDDAAHARKRDAACHEEGRSSNDDVHERRESCSSPASR